MTSERQRQKALAHISLQEGKIPEAILGEMSVLIESVQNMDLVKKEDLESCIQTLASQIAEIGQVIASYEAPEQECLLPILEDIKKVAVFIAKKDFSVTSLEEKLVSLKKAVEATDLKDSIKDQTSELVSAFGELSVAVSKIHFPEIDLTSLEQAVKEIKIPVEDGKVPVKLSKEDIKELKNALRDDKVYVGGGGGMSRSDMVAALSESNLVTSTVFNNNLQGYQIMGGPITVSGYLYIGKEDKDGNWLIKRKNTTTKDWSWCKGSSGFSTAWTNKTSQTYNSYSVIF